MLPGQLFWPPKSEHLALLVALLADRRAVPAPSLLDSATAAPPAVDQAAEG